MNSKPSPPRPPHDLSTPQKKLLIVLCLIPAVVPVALIVFRLFGLICPYSVPNAAMSPVIAEGDHVLMENFTFQCRQPKRGDIVVFKATDIPGYSSSTRLVKRIIGEPGERVRLDNEQLYINDKLMVLSNDFGAITYGMAHFPPSFRPLIAPAQTNVTVPAASYFLVGDRATNSYDSRFFGSVPRQNIIGRIWFCFWPPDRIGLVK